MSNIKKDKVISDIEMIYKHGDCKYAIWNYVPKNFWVKQFRDWFPDIYFENETDFNYSVCFSMSLSLSLINGGLMSKEFDDLIKEKGLVDFLVSDISVLAPYAIVRYVRYRLIDNESIPFSSYVPFESEHTKYGDKLKKHLQEKGITLLDDEILFAKVDAGISLENRTEDVRVYNCLFNDTDVWPR